MPELYRISANEIGEKFGKVKELLAGKYANARDYVFIIEPHENHFGKEMYVTYLENYKDSCFSVWRRGSEKLFLNYHVTPRYLRGMGKFILLTTLSFLSSEKSFTAPPIVEIPNLSNEGIVFYARFLGFTRAKNIRKFVEFVLDQGEIAFHCRIKSIRNIRGFRVEQRGLTRKRHFISRTTKIREEDPFNYVEVSSKEKELNEDAFKRALDKYFKHLHEKLLDQAAEKWQIDISLPYHEFFARAADEWEYQK